MFFKKLRTMQAERYAAWRASQPWLLPAGDEPKFMQRIARQIHEIDVYLDRRGYDEKSARRRQLLLDEYKRRSAEF